MDIIVKCALASFTFQYHPPTCPRPPKKTQGTKMTSCMFSLLCFQNIPDELEHEKGEKGTHSVAVIGSFAVHDLYL